MSEQRVNELLQKFDEWNNSVIKELLPGWCHNVGMNLEISKRSAYYKEERAKKKHCIVVASGPSATDENILALKDYTGDIIVCNKQLMRFIRLGVLPHWCLLLDSNPVSLGQFDFQKMWEDGLRSFGRSTAYENVKYLISTTAFPGTVQEIYQAVPESRLYMFNPVVGTGGEVDVATIWNWINGCPELAHGGNVGTMAFQFAKNQGYEVIGLLGYDLYEELDPNWTVEQAKEREYLYFPDMNKVVAIPFHFLSYSQCLANTVLMWHGNDPKSPRKAVNLSESPLMRHINVFEQRKVKDYVEWTQGL